MLSGLYCCSSLALGSVRYGWIALLASLSLTLVCGEEPGGCKSEVVPPPPDVLLTLLCSQYHWAGGTGRESGDTGLLTLPGIIWGIQIHELHLRELCRDIIISLWGWWAKCISERWRLSQGQTAWSGGASRLSLFPSITITSSVWWQSTQRISDSTGGASLGTLSLLWEDDRVTQSPG